MDERKVFDELEKFIVQVLRDDERLTPEEKIEICQDVLTNTLLDIERSREQAWLL